MGPEGPTHDLIEVDRRTYEALLAACKEFVRKVECGEARSHRSYAQMKQAIKAAESGW